MSLPGTLYFTEEEYLQFMSGKVALAYHPDYYRNQFQGREVIVNDFEVESYLAADRFLVLKKWG